MENVIIYFCRLKEKYGCFSNFAPYRIELKGLVWPTSEHYYQAQKFVGTEHEEEVRRAKSPKIAARLGRDPSKPLRADWALVKEDVMREAVRAKFQQHAKPRDTLLATGNATIVEFSKRDSYWGNGGDDSGLNRLGHILMEIRAELRSGDNA